MISMILVAAATQAAPLSLETRVLAERRAAAADGTTRTELVTPSNVGPGDAVVVDVRYRNAGAQPLRGVVIANPVPRGLAYRGPHTGPAPELSVDGRRFGPLAGLRVAAAGGATRPATLADVTHVRWRLSSPVTAGGGGEFAFQAVVR